MEVPHLIVFYGLQQGHILGDKRPESRDFIKNESAKTRKEKGNV